MIYGQPVTFGGGKPKKLLSSLTEGSIVSVLEDGKLTPFYVAKHNYEADLNGAGRTLLVRKDLHSQRVWHSTNYDTYSSSDIDAWLNGDYKAMLSSVVQAQIGLTNFYHTQSYSNKTVATLNRAVFIPSMTEFGLTYNGANVEGSALPIASALRIAYLNGTVYAQWTRSPYLSASGYACFVSATGTADAHPATNTYKAVRPCFTLPATMALRDEPFADGSWTLADEDILIDTETASTMAKSGVTYTNGIADLTSTQLNEIAAAISTNPNITKQTSEVYYDKGDVHRKISVGDTQNITVGGVSYPVAIVGFNHDDLSLGREYGNPTATGKAGMTFQMVNCHTTDPMNGSDTNSGGWTSSWMRTNLIPVYLGNIAAELQSVLKSVNKLTSAGSKSSAINATADTLFLLSEIEIFGSTTHSFSGEGNQYAYYKAGNSKIKTLHAGSTTAWWGRSPANDNISFCNTTATGTASGVNSGARAPIGVAFAYCI